MALLRKPPYWEVDAHAPTTAPDATAPHDAKLSSFLQGVEGWEDFPLIFSEEHQFGILHRLDLPSSGLILVGKTFRGYFSLRWQQDTYDLGRNYLVLCHGVEEQVVNARLKTTKSNPVSSCVSASGKPAWTHFQPLLLLSRGTEKYTLLIVVIRTGRTHQIRVHAQHIGHPTVADTKYGGALAAEDLRWCPRNFLHRFQLRFQEMEGAPTAPVPTQMAPPYPAACRPRPRLSSTNSAENLGQNVQWSRPPADVHSRLLYLEHSFMELRSDMERRSQELSTQVESLAQTLHRLDGQMLHGKTNGEAACSCPQLKKIVSLTLLELEKLTRRANDAFDRSACSSIKQIQELQHLTESIDRTRGPPMGWGPLGDVEEAGFTAADGIREGQYSCFRVSRPHEGILEVVLNRAEARNSMSAKFVRELHQILDVLQFPYSERDHPPLRVLILRGEGNAFCSGYDFKDQTMSKANTPFLQHAFSGLIKKLRDLPQPVVCGVNGAAVGAGLSLALAADLRIGAREASFVAAFVKLGLGGGELGTSYFLPRIVGRGRAAEALLTGKPISASKAEQWGLLNEVVDQAQLANCCLKHAKELLALSPKGLRLTKSLLNNSQELSLTATLDREDLAQSYMAET
eukprot:g23902.t1